MKVYRVVAHRGSSDELEVSILGASPNNCPSSRRNSNPKLQNLTHATRWSLDGVFERLKGLRRKKAILGGMEFDHLDTPDEG